MILATKNHLSENPDSLFMLDIDLGVVGAEPAVFERCDQAIQKEYSWAPDADFRVGRTKVLASFLERPAIFQTRGIRNQYEIRARENLRRTIAQLAA